MVGDDSGAFPTAGVGEDGPRPSSTQNGGERTNELATNTQATQVSPLSFAQPPLESPGSLSAGVPSIPVFFATFRHPVCPYLFSSLS